jgi:cell migration-inducing and hyaluronan-binding protein
MMSFQTTADAPACAGTIAADDNKRQNVPTVRDLKGLAPPPARSATVPTPMADMYYPHAAGAIHSTLCERAGTGRPDDDLYDCSKAKVCSKEHPGSCAVPVLDHYTSSFNWATGAISSVWLRGFWYLVDNSVFTDVQNAALTFVSGGDFTHASVIPGYWALVRNSIFVGHTQTGNGFAKDSGPFNNDSKLKCDLLLPGQGDPPYCLSTPEGVSLPLVSFNVNQRLFNIYDGPAYEDTNAFLDINKTENCEQGYNNGCIYNIQPVLGVPKDPATGKCYLPNAAIAWKQPNGFFYPPAFHSTNLFFNNVDIRHYVIAPLFDQNTYKTNKEASEKVYCTLTEHLFNGFSAIDRQTELNDDDGSLTGLKQTVSVNEDAFFNAPVETPECWSNIGTNNDPQNVCKPTVKTQAPVTAKTSPYDYVTTVIYHPETVKGDDQIWSRDCASPTCYGVPLFRQSLTGNDGQKGEPRTREWAQWYENPKTKENCDANPNTVGCRWPFIRMAGTDNATRETMTVNGASYYIDTTVPRDMQAKEDLNFQGGTVFFNVFQPKETYTVFFLYLKGETHQTYQIYVGTDFTENMLKAVRVEIPTADFKIEPLEGPLPDWLKPDWSAVKTTGVLTLKTDFNSVSDLLKPTPANGLCKPADFCKADGDKCVGNVSENDPRFWVVGGHTAYGPTEANAICSQWAVKDLDCPISGCLGFQFTLPSKFEADAKPDAPSPHRPKPQSLPDSIQFTRTATVPDNKKPEDPDKYHPACFYPSLPVASNAKPPETCLVP